MKISGAGCCLLDFLYTDCSFHSEQFKMFQSRMPGDGGLVPGGLVFSRQLARYAGLSEEEVLSRLTGGKRPDSINIGGPGVIAMIHAAQMLDPREWECSFHGVYNTSAGFSDILRFLDKIPLHFIPVETQGAVPSTTVLSDPEYHDGAGERTFINTLGAADRINPDHLDEEFFDADIFLWGGTALVPPLHEKLADLLAVTRSKGKVNIVGTVYDFRNESLDPVSPWPLGTCEKPAYPYIDLLIADSEEAFRLSGTHTLDEAVRFFKNSGVGAFMITRGREDMFLFAHEKSLFKSCPGIYLPVSPFVNEDLRRHPEKKGDTTGCGDNFMGGVLVSVAGQMNRNSSGSIDPVAAAVEGISAGGLALYSCGGCMTESFPHEKKSRIDQIKQHYLTHTLPSLGLEYTEERA